MLYPTSYLFIPSNKVGQLDHNLPNFREMIYLLIE